MRFLIFLSLTLLSSLTAKSPSGLYSSPEWDELRIEIDDLKDSLRAAQIDLSLQEERLRKQEGSLGKPGKDLKEASQVAILEKRLLTLEKTLEKLVTDVRSLSTSFTQLSNHLEKVQGHLSIQEEKLGEVGKLKTTLTSIAQAVRSPSTVSAENTKEYIVKAGDSLEKIARQHHLSVETLRKLNHLSQDKILVGQKLRVTDEAL